MDDAKRETLNRIQLALQELLDEGRITEADAGKQLVRVAYDYVRAGEILHAREVLDQCAEGYFTDHMPRHRKEDSFFDRQASEVDDVFALEYYRAGRHGLA